MNDDKQKIEFYKRFESCETVEEVDILETELIDRFGTPPAEVNTLVELERIRAIASSLKISEILEENSKIRIRISSFCTIPGEKLSSAVSKDKRLSLEPKEPELLIFSYTEKGTEKKLTELKKWLQQFM